MALNPLVIGHHLIWTLYGWWLPNDPRGSMSTTVKSDILAQLGELHHGRKKAQPAGREIRAFYREARPLLKHPLLQFDDAARSLVAAGFAQAIATARLTCWACAIMPDHIHVLIRKHRLTAEEMMDLVRNTATTQLRSLAAWADHPIWGGPGWKVFLDHPDDVRRTIGYVERNPDPYHLPRQNWPFVQPYDGWPLHPGHNPNSPYAQGLRAVGRYP
jgi:REP element-mobilizing transposase RayT